MSGLDVPWSGGTGHRVADIRRQFFLVDDEARNIHFRGAYEIAANRWSPRHRHTFEQIRYQMKGDQTYGRHRWNPGTFGYFPEAVAYGPHKSGEGGFEEIDLQWPSPTGGYFGSNEDLVRAMTTLKEQGVKFEGGLAHLPSGKKQDGTEACWEFLLGGKVNYAKPRYRDPVFIETENLSWAPTSCPGVQEKHLGHFHQGGPDVSLLRLEAGATTPAGVHPAYQVRFVVEGELDYAGQRCPAVSCLYYPPGLPYEGLHSASGATVLVIKIHPPTVPVVGEAS